MRGGLRGGSETSVSTRRGRDGQFGRGIAVFVVVAALTALLASCSSSQRYSAPPAGLPRFYSVPEPLPSSTPGALLKAARLGVPGVPGRVYRVMYVSLTESGKPTPVTGLVFVPPTPPPRGGYPVVSWAHGTNGMAPQCAPSLQPTSAVPLVSELLDHGYEVVATDYQGEGTAGLLPYLVGDVEAHDVIDIVRAARQLPAAHASRRYVVWGHSEGGQSALFAMKVAPSYAPGLHLEGVVATAPPSQLLLVYQALKDSFYRFYLVMAGAGFHVAYGARAPLSEIATPLAIRLMPDLSKGCEIYIASLVDRYPLSALIAKDPADVPTWRSLIEANDPESFSKPSPAPLLIIQGSVDREIPAVSSELLTEHLCSIGQDVERWLYPGYGHNNVIPASAPDMLHWIADRFAGKPNPDPYVPHAVAGVTTTTCAGRTSRK